MLRERYEIIESCCHDGPCELLRARAAPSGAPITIRILRAGIAPGSEAELQLRREQGLLGRLDHPSVLNALEVGEEGGRPFIVTERPSEVDLAQRLRDGPLVAAAHPIARQICEALDHAHGRSVLHCDLKPAAVLVDGERAWLSGWSRAQDTDDPAESDLLIGSPEYVSPEQLRGEPATRRSDLYSLGAVLYELLAGRPPFDGPSPAELIYASLHREPLPLQELSPAAPPDLVWLSWQLLSKDPELRPTSSVVLESLLD